MSNWEIRKICEVSTVKGGKRIPKGYVLQDENNGYPYITVSDMKENGISLENIKYVPLEILNKIKNYKIYLNEIYISVAGTIGNVGIIPKELNGANLTENADKFTNIKINQLFLLYFLRSSLFQNVINNNKTTSAQPKLAIEKINNIKIPVPPLPEQEKIVSILSKQDEVIEKLEKLIELKVRQKKGVMQKLLSGKVRLKGFNGEWEEKRLGDILEQRNNKNNNIKRVLSINNKRGFILPEEQFSKEVASADLSKYKIVEKNDFAYNPARINIGSIAKLDKYDCGVVSPMYIVFRCKNINSNYMKYLVLTNDFDTKIKMLQQGSVRSVVDFKNLSFIKIKLPPTIQEQFTIASILSKCDKEIELLKTKLELHKKQKKWLMQKLLSGEIRVGV